MSTLRSASPGRVERVEDARPGGQVAERRVALRLTSGLQQPSYGSPNSMTWNGLNSRHRVMPCCCNTGSATLTRWERIPAAPRWVYG